MPFGSTGTFMDEEWANGVGPHQGWASFVARDLVRAVDARYRTIRRASGRAIARALRGRLRRAQHRAAPSRRVPRRRELVGLRARSTSRRSSAPPRAAAANSPLDAARRGRPPSAASTRTSGSTAARRTRCAARTRLRRRARPRRDPAPLPRRPRRPHVGDLARARRPRASSPPRGTPACVGWPRRRSCSPSRSPRRAGSTCSARACRARGSRTRCRSTARARRRRPARLVCRRLGRGRPAARRLRPLGAARPADGALALGLGGRALELPRRRRLARGRPQVPVREAFDAALSLQAVYLPAALVGLAVRRGRAARPRRAAAGALARRARRPRRQPRPPRRDPAGHGPTLLVGALTPDVHWPLARALGALAGLALLLAARGLARRRRRAWLLALGVSALAVVLHALHGVDEGTIALGASCGGRARRLPAGLRRAGRRGDAAARRRAGPRSPPADLRLRRGRALGQPGGRRPADSARFALREDSRGGLPASTCAARRTSAAASALVPASLLLLGAAAHGLVLAAWLAPWRHRLLQEARERELARALVRTWGADTLAPFVLRADKSYFFDARRAPRFSPTASSAASPSSPATRSGRAGALRARSSRGSSPSRTRATGGSRSSAPPSAARPLPRRTGCTPSTTATRRSSTRPRSRSRAARSARCGSPCTGSGGGLPRRRAPPARDRPELRAELEAIAADVARRASRSAASRWRSTSSSGSSDEDAVFVVGFDPDGAAVGFLHFAVVAGRRGALALLDAAPARRPRTASTSG